MLKRWFSHLYIQVLCCIVLGIAVGYFFPHVGNHLKPLAFMFVRAIKMIIAPIIFLSLISGITAAGSIKAMGKTGGAALIYFLTMTALALLIGLTVANLLGPGHGLNINLSDFNGKDVHDYTGNTLDSLTFSHFFLHLMPDTFVGALANGEILQVLIVAILFAAALLQLGEKGKRVSDGVQLLAEVFFKIIGIIVRFAPLGAFAAMGYTIAHYGLSSLVPLLYLLLCFYVTCIVFLLAGLGLVLKLYCNINIFKLLAYIKDELFIVLGTSSSESVLPSLLHKLEQLGCDKSIVSLVLPVGYSFNLDGTCIYLTMGAIFIAQALNIELSLTQELSLLGIMLLTSKGAAGITGSGFIILAATLTMVDHIPAESVVLILGVDRFMSEGRSLTNMIGNSIATLILAKWQSKLDTEQCRLILSS